MRKKICKILGIVSVAVGVVYVMGVLVFTNHFAFRTYVNNQNVTLFSSEDIKASILQNANSQSVTLLRRGGSKEIVPFSKLGIYIKTKDDVSIEPENGWLWFMSLFKRMDYEIPLIVDYDNDILAKGVCDLNCVASDYVLPATDGYVSLNDDGSYNIIEASSGTELNVNKLIDVICESVCNQDYVIDLEASNCYKKPLLQKQDFKYPVNADISDIQVKLNLTDDNTITVPSEIIKSSVYVVNDVKYVKYSMIKAYVNSLAREYNTVGSIRKFKTSYGDTIELKPSTYDNFLGWQLDVVKTTKGICKALSGGVDTNIDVSWTSVGKVLKGKDNDFGDTYIELSIDKQHMWVYNNGQLLLDTDVTTGTDVDGRRTPRGMFHTMDWNTEYTMHGSYGTAFAHYFIRITSFGVGIHDSTWRTNYGGSYYKTNGSHGCINTPYNKMVMIYDSLKSKASDSIPVIIY